LIGLCTACPVVLAQGQAVAPGGTEDVPSAAELDVPYARTEGPRETFDSFLRLKNELETRASTYLQDHRRADFDRLISARNVAEGLLDLSAVPQAAKDEVAVDTLVALLDIFDRIDVPPLDSVPKAEDFDQNSASAGWRVPNTPLRIGRVDAGERQGEFLLTARTVAIAPRFSRQIRHLPSRSPAGIDSWSDALSNLTGPSIPGDLVDGIPPPLREHWLGTPIWKEILIALLSAAAGILLLLWHRLVARYATNSKVNAVALKMLTPAALLLAVLILEPFFANEIDTAGEFATAVEFTATALRSVAAIWLFWLAVQLIVERIVESPRIEDESLNVDFVRMLGRILRLVGVVLIASFGLHRLGVSALSVLAGLGIGSAAVALAVQPALIDLMAGLTLYREGAIRVGDFVRFGGLEGRVEAIGVRSTHIRAPDQTLIWVPNSNLVSAEVISWGYSNRMEIRLELNLSDHTTPDQMRSVLAKLREMLDAHPKIESETVRVRFSGYGDDSMDISLRVFALTTDWNDFYAIQEDVLLRLNDIIEESDTDFSAQSQVVYLNRFEGPDPERGEQLEHTLDYPPAGSPDAPKPE
jgi:MscS family membrane protein